MKLEKAYKVIPECEEYDRTVAIVYWDNFDRRCTMFVTTGTDPGVQVLIDLISSAVLKQDALEAMHSAMIINED